MGLFEVELRRALARRLVRFIVVLGLFGVVLAGIITTAKSSRTPRANGVTVIQGPRFEDCVSQPEGPWPGAPRSPERIGACNEQAQEIAREQARYNDRRFYLTKLKDILGGMTAPMTLLAILFGASLIGAEWRHGTIGTTLTWEPRRIRLIVAKLLAALLVCLVFYVLIYAVLSLMLWLAATTRGTTAGAGRTFARAVVGQSMRGALVIVFGTCLGFAFGTTTRNTASALGVGFAYVVILEQILFGVVKWIRPWLVIPNAAIVVRGQGIGEIFGYTPGRAAIKLSCYAAGLVLISIGVFRARDVGA